jgi:hypothetical protein
MAQYRTVQVDSEVIQLIHERLVELQEEKERTISSKRISGIDKRDKIRQIEHLIMVNKRLLRRK